jgi:hypothetical protein
LKIVKLLNGPKDIAHSAPRVMAIPVFINTAVFLFNPNCSIKKAMHISLIDIVLVMDAIISRKKNMVLHIEP